MSINIFELQELYTQDQLITAMLNKVSTIFGSIDYDDDLVRYMIRAIYRWYKTNYVAFTSTTAISPEDDIKDIFIDRITDDFTDVYLSFEKKAKHFLSITGLDDIYIRGGMKSKTIITPDLENSNFTKQASTPSVVSPTDDFVDEYTDYQSKSTSKHTGSDTHETDLSRTGGQKEGLEVLELLPKSLTNEMINAVKYNFIIVGVVD